MDQYELIRTAYRKYGKSISELSRMTGHSRINNIAFPSLVSSRYAPPGKTLIAIVVLGKEWQKKNNLSDLVQMQCVEWFGKEVKDWTHL